MFELKAPPLSTEVFLKNNTTQVDLFTNQQNDSSDLTGIDRRKKCDKVFKNGPSKICERQPLKNLKGSGLLRQAIPFQFF